jgi:hypothetical protein
MSKLDDWAAQQWAGMQQGAKDVAVDAIGDVGTTYQAILMGDAGWRVPRAHDDMGVGLTQDIAEQAAAAELEQQISSPEPDPTVDLDR